MQSRQKLKQFQTSNKIVNLLKKKKCDSTRQNLRKKLKVLATRTKNIQIKRNIKDGDIAFLHFQNCQQSYANIVCFVCKMPICVSKVFHRKMMRS